MTTAVRPAGEGPPTGSELRTALGPLWPDLGQPHSATEWAILPTANAPRLLVPVGSRRAAAQTISEQRRTAASAKARVAGAVLAAGVRYGPGTVLLRRRASIGSGDAVGGGLVGQLEELLGRRLEVAVYLGFPRRNRKPVLKLYDRDGHLQAVAKVGVDDLTAALVRNEHAALTRLQERADVVEVPTPLALMLWDDTVMVVQSALAVGTGRQHRPTTAALRTVSDWLAGDDTAKRTPVETSGWWASVVARVAGAPADALGDRLRATLDLAGAALRGRSLAMAPWHGDLTPWNMAAAAGRPQVWDWERYAPQAPVGCDVLHFTLQARAYHTDDVGAVMSVGLRQAPATLRHVTADEDVAAVAACYALELSTRYVSEGQALFSRGAQAVAALLDHADRAFEALDSPTEHA